MFVSETWYHQHFHTLLFIKVPHIQIYLYLTFNIYLDHLGLIIIIDIIIIVQNDSLWNTYFSFKKLIIDKLNIWNKELIFLLWPLEIKDRSFRSICLKQKPSVFQVVFDIDKF